MMRKPENWRFTIEIPILCAAGVLLWSLTSRNTGATTDNAVPDLLFAVGSVFLVRGILMLLNRSHAFSLTAESFRFVHRLFRGRTKTEEKTEKKPAREPVSRNVSLYLTIAGLLTAVSVLTWIL